jgi:hypothetical protein
MPGFPAWPRDRLGGFHHQQHHPSGEHITIAYGRDYRRQPYQRRAAGRRDTALM